MTGKVYLHPDWSICFFIFVVVAVIIIRYHRFCKAVAVYDSMASLTDQKWIYFALEEETWKEIMRLHCRCYIF